MNTLKLSFRSRSQIFLNNKFFFLIAATACLGLSMYLGAAGYYLGIAIIIVVAWSNRWKFSTFGLKKGNFIPSLLTAFFYAVLLLVVFDSLLQPIVESYFGKINLESFEGMRGNLLYYLAFLLFMWIMAAFGEELFYRGFLMKRIAEYLGNKNEYWFLAAAIVGVFFGLAHLYQGISGIITTGLIGFAMGLIFMKSKNLLIPILVHGIYDTIGLTLIFLGEERWITDLFLN
jgi:membrane protease YdiL (CAAX protease family)